MADRRTGRPGGERWARQSSLAVLGLAAAVLAVVGGLGTWATAFGLISVAGTRGDGWLVVAAGVLGGAALLIYAARPRAWPAVVAGLAGTGGAVVSGIDLHQLTAAESSSFFGQRVMLVEPGWGIYLSVGATVALALLGLAILAAGAVGTARGPHGATGPRRRRRGESASLAAFAIAAGIAAAVLLSVPGRNHQPSTGGSPATSAVQTGAPTTFTPERHFYGQAQTNSGSTFDVAIDIGKRLQATDAVPSEFSTIADACTINRRRDIVLPLRLALTNTNGGGSGEDIATGLAIRGLQSAGPRALTVEIASSVSTGVTVGGATGYTPGTECNSVRGTSHLLEPIADQRLAAGAHRVHDFLVVVRNYYTPTNPTGRTADLAKISVSPYHTRLSCFSGTGASGGRFKLDGSPAPKTARDVGACRRTR